MLINVLWGTGLGIFASASPGALVAYLLQQTIQHGWRRALPAVLAPLISDIPVVLVVVFVLGRLPPGWLRILQCVGGAFLLVLAFEAWRGLRDHEMKTPAIAPGPQTFVRAVLANGLSAGPYIFWSLVAGPLLVQLWTTSLAAGLEFLLGYYVALLGTYTAQVFIFATIRRVGRRAQPGCFQRTFLFHHPGPQRGGLPGGLSPIDPGPGGCHGGDRCRRQRQH
jgi:threonine/homoserine/homoserine lactone efflux protein